MPIKYYSRHIGSVEEILMHQDRRVELFQAQSPVTELHLNNLSRRMETIRNDASRYSPYSGNSSAPMIPEELADDIRKKIRSNITKAV